MIALTSISPKHSHEGIQEQCAQSWIDNGLKIFSVNGYAEIEMLRERFPEVNFIGTSRTFEHKWGKPYVGVNALLDFAKEQEDEHILILNSDIFLHNAKDVLEENFKHEFCYAHRLDVEEVEPLSMKSKPMLWGIDIFLVNKRILNIFPQTSFAVGLTHWDYWFPWVATKNGIKPHEIKTPFAYHKIHPQQWSNEVYQSMGHYCLLMTDYEGVVKPKPFLILKDVQRQGDFMMRAIKK